MDIVAQIAVLARRQHPHAGARPAVLGRAFEAHRQRFDKGVEPARVLEVPADPAALQRLGTEMIRALGVLYSCLLYTSRCV